MLVAQGKFSPGLVLNEEIQFDINRLNYNNLASIPADLYFDARHDDCWDQQTYCSTITEDQYRPDLILPKSVWTSYLSLQYDCPYVILRDPPVELSSAPDQFIPVPSVTILSFGTKSPEPPRPGQNVPLNHLLPTGLSQSENTPRARYSQRPGFGHEGNPRDESQFIGEYRSGDFRPGGYSGKPTNSDQGSRTERPALLNPKEPGSWRREVYDDSRLDNEDSGNASSRNPLDEAGVKN